MVRRFQNYQDILQYFSKQFSGSTAIYDGLLLTLCRCLMVEKMHPMLRHEIIVTLHLICKTSVIQTALVSKANLRKFMAKSLEASIRCALLMDAFNQNYACEIIEAASKILYPKKLSTKRVYSLNEHLDSELPRLMFEKFPYMVYHLRHLKTTL